MRTTFLLLSAVAFVHAARLHAQDPRDSLIAQASREFDTHRRVPLLVVALNPSLGPPSGTWAVGVQLLAQTLIEDGKDSVAAVWLRWALRQMPQLQPDTVQFLPEVVEAVRSARSAVATTAGADTAAVTRWAWPSGEPVQRQGRIVVMSPGSTAPLGVDVRGVGAIEPEGSPLDPATYHITVSAPGYDNVQVTLEVLPGVTTIIVTHLRASTPVAARPLQPTPPMPMPVAIQQKRGKGFPWIVAALGVGGAAGVAVLLASRQKSDGASTGAIIITFTP